MSKYEATTILYIVMGTAFVVGLTCVLIGDTLRRFDRFLARETPHEDK